MFFANDVILFSEATFDNANLMRKCMDSFYGISRKKLNYSEFYVYISKNVGSNVANSLAKICGFPLTSDLGNYLGLPLIHERVNQHTYQYLVGKVSD